MIQNLTRPLFNPSNYTQGIIIECLFRYNLLKFAEDLLKNNQTLEVSHTNRLSHFAELLKLLGGVVKKYQIISITSQQKKIP